MRVIYVCMTCVLLKIMGQQNPCLIFAEYCRVVLRLDNINARRSIFYQEVFRY